MRCLRCQVDLGTEGIAPGTVVACPQCGYTIGTVGVGAPPKAPTTREPAPALPRTSRGLKPPRRSSPNYIAWGMIVVALAAIGYFVFKGEPAARPAPPPKKAPETVPEPPVPPTAVYVPPPPPPTPADPPPEKKTKTVKYKGQDYTVPIQFMGGAEKISTKFPPKHASAGDAPKVRPLLEKKDFEELLKKPWETYVPVLANALTDDEEIAKAAFEYLDRVALKYKMPGLVKDEIFRVPWELFDAPASRSALYGHFLDFEPSLKSYWEKEAAGGDPFSKEPTLAREHDWEKLISALTGYQVGTGGASKYAFEDIPDEPGKSAFEAFQKVKKMGKPAYPYLVKFIVDENPQRMKTAIIVLHVLTGYPDRIPKPSESRQAFHQWLKDLGLTEAQIPK